MKMLIRLWRMRAVPYASGLTRADLRKMKKTYRDVSDPAGVLLVDTIERMEAARARLLVLERERLANIVREDFLKDVSSNNDFERGYDAAAADFLDLLETNVRYPSEVSAS